MTVLRQRILDDMRIRNLAAETQTSYLRQVAKFARYYGAACETPGACGLAQSSMLLVNAHLPWVAAWMPDLEDRVARRGVVAVGCFDVFSAARGDAGG